MHLVDRACYLTYGGQTNRHDFHFYGYSLTTLKYLLESVGFKNVQRFGRSNLDLALPNDISLAQVAAFQCHSTSRPQSRLIGATISSLENVGPNVSAARFTFRTPKRLLDKGIERTF